MYHLTSLFKESTKNSDKLIICRKCMMPIPEGESNNGDTRAHVQCHYSKKHISGADDYEDHYDYSSGDNDASIHFYKLFLPFKED